MLSKYTRYCLDSLLARRWQRGSCHVKVRSRGRNSGLWLEAGDVRQSEGRVSAEVSSALEFNTCRGKGGSVLPYCWLPIIIILIV